MIRRPEEGQFMIKGVCMATGYHRMEELNWYRVIHKKVFNKSEEKIHEKLKMTLQKDENLVQKMSILGTTQWSYAFWSYSSMVLQLSGPTGQQYYSSVVLRVNSTTAQWSYVSVDIQPFRSTFQRSYGPIVIQLSSPRKYSS